MNKASVAVIAGVGILALIGGGSYAVAQFKAQEAMALIESHIVKNAEGAKVTYSGVSPNIFDWTMTVRDLKISDSAALGTVTIASATLGGDENVLQMGVFENVTVTSPGSAMMKIDRVDITDLNLKEANSPAAITPQTVQAFFSTLNVGAFVVENIQLRSPESVMSISEIRIGGGEVLDVAITDMRDEEVRGEVMEVGFKSLKISNLNPSLLGNNNLETVLRDFFGVTESSLSGAYLVSNDKERVSLERLGVEGIKRTDGMITAFRVFVDGAEIPLKALKAQSPEVGHFLRGIEQNSVRLKAVSEGDIDLKSGVLKYEFALSAGGMGEFKLGLELTGVDAKTLRQADQLSEETLRKVKIVRVSLKYKDDKLADTVIDNISGGDRAKLAEQMAPQVQMFAGADEQTGAMAAGAVTNFITAANSFDIVASPPQPFALSRIQQAMARGTLARDLNIQINGK